MSEPLRALPASLVRARRRPAAIVLVYLWEAISALVVATPVHAWARRVWGGHPDGDAVLWQPGGRELLVWLGQSESTLPVVTRTVLVSLVVAAVLAQLPLGALLVSLGFARVEPDAPPEAAVRPAFAPRAVTALRAAMNAFLPLAVLLALLAVADGVVLAVGTAASTFVDQRLVERIGDARAFQVRLVVFALFAAAATVLGVFVDLARAAVGREAGLASARGSVHPAWNVMLRGIRVAMTTCRPLRALASATVAWAWRALLGGALLAAGWAAASALGGRGGGALVLLFAVHQLVVLGRVALRASWLADATRRVIPAQDALLERAPDAASDAAPSDEAPADAAPPDATATSPAP